LYWILPIVTLSYQALWTQKQKSKETGWESPSLYTAFRNALKVNPLRGIIKVDESLMLYLSNRYAVINIIP